MSRPIKMENPLYDIRKKLKTLMREELSIEDEYDLSGVDLKEKDDEIWILEYTFFRLFNIQTTTMVFM